MTRAVALLLVSGAVFLVAASVQAVHAAQAVRGAEARPQGTAPAVVPTNAPADRRSSNDRVYTDAQADRGQVLFGDVCLVCHTDPFWKPSWQGRSLGELYTSIRRFMPDDNPGTLTGGEVVSALAYILRSNGVPAGTVALPDDPDALSLIAIDAPSSTALPVR